jgi:hypothetical protein
MPSLLATVENLLELAESSREQRRLQQPERLRRDALAARYDLRGTVYASDAMERIIEMASRVARAESAGADHRSQRFPARSATPNSSMPIRAQHRATGGAELRRRPGRPDRGPSCSAPRPAPTRAQRVRARAAFEAAHGGTLFLDEIGDLPLAGR